MATIKGIKVGSSVITATYGSLSSTVTVNVGAFTLNNTNVTFTGLSNQTYSGSAIKLHPTVTATVSDESKSLVEGTDYTIGWTSSDSNSCIAAGTVTVTITGTGDYTGSASTTYTINPATITVKTSGQTTLKNQSYTWNGGAQGVGLVATTVNSQTATIQYKVGSSGTFSTTVPKITNVGDGPITVYYKVTAPNHSELSGSDKYYTLTITPATVTIPTATGNTKTYNGTTYYATFPAASYTTVKYQSSSNGTSGWSDLSTTNPGRSTQGTTYVRAQYTADANHTIGGSTAGDSGYSNVVSVVINPATITVKTSGQSSLINQSYTWTGSAQGVGLVATTVNSQTATIQYKVGSSGTFSSTVPQITNVSQSPITVYYKVTAPNHSELSGESCKYTLTINPAPVSIPTPTSISKTYDGNEYKATFGSASYLSISKYQTSSDGSSWSDASPSTTNPGRTVQGTTYVRAQYTADGNHTIGGSTAGDSGYSSAATITINYASFTVTANNQEYTYGVDTSPFGQHISVSGLKGGQSATIKYGTTSGSYTLDGPVTRTSAGQQTVYWQVTAPNHTPQTGDYVLKVNKGTPTFALQGDTQPYHDESHNPQTAYIKARASVVGTIHWGASTSTMTSTTSISTASTTTFNTTVTSRSASSENAGTTTIYAYFIPTDTTNWNSVYQSNPISASAKLEASGDNDISVTVIGTLYCTGAEQTIATVDSVEGCSHFTLGYSTASGGTVTWGTQDATQLKVTGPGTYYIHYKVEPDGNHTNTITDEQLTGTSVINNGTLTISVTGYSGTYDGNAHNVVASGPTAKNQTNTTVTGVTYTYSTSENGTYGSMPTRTAATATNANPNAKVTYWVKAEKAGYTTVKKSFDVFIDKAANPLTISSPSTTSSNRKKIYNTTGYNTVQISTSGAQGSVSYASSDTTKATVSSSGLVTYVAAGTPNITVTAAGNDNYWSGSKIVYIETVVDTVTSYGDIGGALSVTQDKQFPAGGLTLDTSNITTYYTYTSTCTQTKTWASGNTTSGTISYTWSGTSKDIASLGTTEKTETTTITGLSFILTATGEGGKTKTAPVSSGVQEANPVTAIELSIGGTTGTKNITFGSSHTTAVKATFKSGDHNDNFTKATIESGTPSVVQVL